MRLIKHSNLLDESNLIDQLLMFSLIWYMPLEVSKIDVITYPPFFDIQIGFVYNKVKAKELFSSRLLNLYFRLGFSMVIVNLAFVTSGFSITFFNSSMSFSISFFVISITSLHYKYIIGLALCQ